MDPTSEDTQVLENTEDFYQEDESSDSQDEGRIFRTRAILSFLDGPFYNFDVAQILIENQPTPIKNDDGKLIGFASVQLLNKTLVADLRIDYATPERLSAETQDGVRYWPRVRGDLKLLEPQEHLDLYGFCVVVEKISIKEIVLSTYRPGDSRLLPLGELVL